MRNAIAAKCLLPIAVAVGAAFAGMAHAADGLAAPSPSAAWPTWQARLTLTTPQGQGLALAPSAPLQQAALLGDWYFTGTGPARAHRWRGGLHATGGLVLGHLGHAAAVSASPFSVSLLSAPDALADGAAANLRPYLGLGYAGTSADGGLSFSADLGLVAGRPGALFGSQGLSQTLRQLELVPVLRLGVNYAF